MKNKRIWQWVGVIAACIALIAVGMIVLNHMAKSDNPAAKEPEAASTAGASETGETTETSEKTGPTEKTDQPEKTEATASTEAAQPTENSGETSPSSNTVTEPSELPPEIGELTYASMPNGIVLPEDPFEP